MNLSAAHLVFAALAALTLGAVLAVGLARDAVRSALAAALGFVGVGLLFIWMGADFLGFIQLLVYVGAVAVLIVFVILLTRRRGEPGSTGTNKVSIGWMRLLGIALPLYLFAALAFAFNRSGLLDRSVAESNRIEIAALGSYIVSEGLLPLFLTGILLTVALVGGVGLALADIGKEDES